MGKRGLLLVLVAVLSACVTTEESVYTNEPAPDEALKTRVELARRYIGEQNWQDAKRNLSMAQDIDPNSPEVHEAFALVYWSTGEFEMSEESFQRAIRLQKDFSRARSNYAAFLYSRDRFTEAEEQLELVVADTLYEARPQAFVNLGLCRARLDDPAGAGEAFERALSMDRTNRIALLELAEIRYQQGRWRESQLRYDTYRGLVRQQSARSLWLGLRLAQQLDNDDAMASYALALRNLYPNSEEYQAYQKARHSGEF